jgi:hypothetical protein
VQPHTGSAAASRECLARDGGSSRPGPAFNILPCGVGRSGRLVLSIASRELAERLNDLCQDWGWIFGLEYLVACLPLYQGGCGCAPIEDRKLCEAATPSTQ